MKGITLFMIIMSSLLVTSCTVVPARDGYYSVHDRDMMQPGGYYYNGGYHDHYFYDRYRSYDDDHDHYLNSHDNHDRDNDHDHGWHNDNDHDHDGHRR